MEFIKVWDGSVNNTHRGMIKPPSHNGEVIQPRKYRKIPTVKAVDRRQKTKLFHIMVGSKIPVKSSTKTGKLHQFVSVNEPISDRRCESYLMEEFGISIYQATNILKMGIRFGYLQVTEDK